MGKFTKGLKVSFDNLPSLVGSLTIDIRLTRYSEKTVPPAEDSEESTQEKGGDNQSGSQSSQTAGG